MKEMMAVRTQRLASLSLVAILAASFIAACGDDPTSPWRYQKVVVTPSGSFPGGRGSSTAFVASMVNNLGEPIPTDGFVWNWSSSNPAVVSIDRDGKATALSVGTAEIRAENAGLQGTTQVSVTQVPTTLAVLSGDKQTGLVGTKLATEASVKVVDAGGTAIASRIVEFSASGGGSVGSKTVQTGADGIAKTTWTLGTKTADPQQLTATSENVSVTLSATPKPDAPTGLNAGSSLILDGWALEALDTTLAVVVVDKYANPVPSVDVVWTVDSGGGTIAPVAGGKTDAAGKSTAKWTLGAATGSQAAHAAMAAAPSTQKAFTATAKGNPIIAGTVSVAPGLASIRAAGPAPVPQPAQATRYAAGDWIVTFEPAAVGAPAGGLGALTSPAAVTAVEQGIEARITALAGGNAFSVAGVSPTTLAARVTVAPGADFDAVGRQLRAQPGVRAVERNRIMRYTDPAPVPAAIPAVTIADAYYPLQAWSYEMIGLDQAWKITTGSSGVIVAVVDDGIRTTHSDLGGQLTTDGYDFVSDTQVPLCTGGTMSNAVDGNGPDNDPTIPAEYELNTTTGCVVDTVSVGGHGLHVAGTIGASAGSTGGVGVSQRVKIRPIRVLGAAGGTEYDIAQGILYAAGLPADNGAGGTVTAPSRAPIINLSLGGPGPASAVLTSAVQAASAAGSLLIAAAGNDGGSSPNYPAAFPEVLSVAAVGPTGSVAPYSSWGSTIDIAAPGGNAAAGGTHQILSTLWDFQHNSATWDYYQGTSMAAPHVAGVAALLLSKEPGLTAAQLRDRLTQYTTPAGDPQYYGAGIVNAFSALTRGAGFKRETYVKIVDAATGATAQTIKAATNGTFRVPHLTIGSSYRVFAGLDEEGDKNIGVVGRSFGALGGAAGQTVSADSSRVYDATFLIGTPAESGTNIGATTADVIPVGGYVTGQLGAGNEDWYSITVPAGTFTFGTTGVKGACGLAGQVNTRIDLYNAANAIIASSDDGTGFDYCGKVTQTLTAGTYNVRVRGSGTISFGELTQNTGSYRFYVR